MQKMLKMLKKQKMPKNAKNLCFISVGSKDCESFNWESVSAGDELRYHCDQHLSLNF